MFKFAPYVLKTLWRHRTRTLLTVGGAAVSLFVFSFVAAVQQAMDELATRNDRSLVVFQANKFCPASSHLPQDYDRRIAALPGVREVVPIQVFTNNCRASLDVVVFYGVPPHLVRASRRFELLSGNWSEFESHQDAALVGGALARRRGLTTGSKFSVGDVTVTVAGVFESPDPADENYVYAHLDFLQRTRGLDLVGTVTQHEVLLDESADAERTASAIDDLLRGGPVATDTRPKGVFQAAGLADLVQLVDLSRWLGWACLGLMAALVSTTTLMSVQDRLVEHAVLQTIGCDAGRIFRLVLAESMLLGFGGGASGVGIAALVLSVSHLSIGAEAIAVSFAPSAAVVLRGLVASLALGFVAGLAPAWQAGSIEIVPALRRS